MSCTANSTTLTIQVQWIKYDAETGLMNRTLSHRNGGRTRPLAMLRKQHNSFEVGEGTSLLFNISYNGNCRSIICWDSCRQFSIDNETSVTSKNRFHHFLLRYCYVWNTLIETRPGQLFLLRCPEATVWKYIHLKMSVSRT